MEPTIARMLGYLGALLVGIGLAGFVGRREHIGMHLGLLVMLQGLLVFAVALGGRPEWLLLVLVVTGVTGTLATAAMANCARATGSDDVANWTTPDTAAVPANSGSVVVTDGGDVEPETESSRRDPHAPPVAIEGDQG